MRFPRRRAGGVKRIAQASVSLTHPSQEDASVVKSNALIQRLQSLSDLTPIERSALWELLDAWEWFPAGAVIEREGDCSGSVHGLLAGLACRHKDLGDGRRQIIAILFPGDLSRDLAGASRPTDHHVRTLTRAKVVRIALHHLEAVIAANPGIERALHVATIVEAAVLRAWIVNLGQRRAHERLAHLFCEMAHRMVSCDLSRPDGSFELPLTQKELGTALGLTSVHVNRVLQKLRAEALVEFANGVLRIRELDRLQGIANFDPAYLSA